ncbi:MAG: efflux transporter outer membrane subunit [Pseudomonadota bacterium]
MNHNHDKPKSPRPGQVTTVLLMLFALGCASVGPDYRPPAPDAPAKWHNGGAAVTAARDNKQLAEWWTVFDDPLLTRLVGMALEENLDLKKAKAAVREARASRGAAQAGLFPTATGSAAATRSRSSENNGSGDTDDLFSLGFDASWELDVFGGVRRAVEAAEADLGAAEADLRDVLASLTAELGTNYIEARSRQARLAAAEQSLVSLGETVDLTQARFQTGLDDELAVLQAGYNREDAAADIPTHKTALEQAFNRLAVLTGRKPGELRDLLAEVKPIPAAPAAASIGPPAETLRQRPDIRKAERELAAQTARIGEAAADLYPKFKLAGSLSLEALQAHKLLRVESLASSLGPSVSWNIFDAGLIRRNIEVQTAKQEQCLAAYEAAVLTALEEVENALVAFDQEQKRREKIRRAADLASQAEGLARQQYLAGLKDFSDVLETQRQLLTYRDQLAQSDAAVAGDLVTLYKALGGGWARSDDQRVDSLYITEGR